MSPLKSQGVESSFFCLPVHLEILCVGLCFGIPYNVVPSIDINISSGTSSMETDSAEKNGQCKFYQRSVYTSLTQVYNQYIFNLLKGNVPFCHPLMELVHLTQNFLLF